jgi:hypothetical protein
MPVESDRPICEHLPYSDGEANPHQGEKPHPMYKNHTQLSGRHRRVQVYRCPICGKTAQRTLEVLP